MAEQSTISRRTISKIIPELEKASAALRTAQDTVRSAESSRLKAASEVNRLQAEFDEALRSVHADAPEGSDWHRARTTVQGTGDA